MSNLIVEISNKSYEDYLILKEINKDKDFMIACLKEGQKKYYTTFPNGDSFDYDFIFVNEELISGLLDLIEQIRKMSRRSTICLAVHKTFSRQQVRECHPQQLCSRFLETEKVIAVKLFHHQKEEPPIWETGIKPFIKIVKESSSNYNTALDNLWQLLAPKPADLADKLRSQLLAHFSVIHLALQDSFEKNWTVKQHPLIFDSECKNACEIIKGDNLKEKLDEFLSYAEDDNKTGINRKYTELKGKIEKLCKVIINNNKDGLADFKDLLEDKKGGDGLIEEFAMTLEKVVETAERRKLYLW